MTNTVAPPRALSTERLWVNAIGGLALFTALAGDGIRNLVSLWVFAAWCVVLSAACIVLFVRVRPPLDRARLPKAVIAFLGLMVLSLAWSAYPLATVTTLWGTSMTTIVGVFAALMFSWDELLRILSNALKWVLGLSLASELFVSIVIRHPVLPLWQDFGDDPPLLAMWSRNELFSGGRIQGIVGNANLLAIIALIAIIVFAVQWAQNGFGWSRHVIWLAIAALIFGLTRSGTMIIAAGIAVLVLAAVLLVRRAATPRGRTAVYLVSGIVTAAAIVFVTAFNNTFLALVGKSSDLTGRIDIWAKVLGYAEQRPWFGWGYSSPWVPFDPFFDEFVVRNGQVQLHAHNAWIDVWFQLGAIGVVLFASIVVSTLWRSWFAAVDRPRLDLRADRPYTALSLLPILVMTVLVVQSVAESRILIESGWVLLIVFALKTKQTPSVEASADQLTPSLTTRQR